MLLWEFTFFVWKGIPKKIEISFIDPSIMCRKVC